MYRKNTAGQFVGFQMVLAATGAKGTGLTVAVRRCLDGTFGDGGGTVTEDGTTGGYKYAMAQADTNANNVSLFFSATGAIPIAINFLTTAADPTDGTAFGLTIFPSNFDILDIASDGTVAIVNSLSSAERDAIADAILDRDMSLGVDSGSPTVRTARQALRFLRNKWAIAAGTLTVYKEDDAAASWTSAVVTNAAADPVTSSDPAS